jgi:hypothetical protein
VEKEGGRERGGGGEGEGRGEEEGRGMGEGRKKGRGGWERYSILREDPCIPQEGSCLPFQAPKQHVCIFLLFQAPTYVGRDCHNVAGTHRHKITYLPYPDLSFYPFEAKRVFLLPS